MGAGYVAMGRWCQESSSVKDHSTATGRRTRKPYASHMPHVKTPREAKREAVEVGLSSCI